MTVDISNPIVTLQTRGNVLIIFTSTSVKIPLSYERTHSSAIEDKEKEKQIKFQRIQTRSWNTLKPIEENEEKKKD